MEIEEISKDLYKIKFAHYIPIYIEIFKGRIKITQPVLEEGETFKRGKYFGKGFPQEIVIGQENLKEIRDFLGKFLIMENLK